MSIGPTKFALQELKMKMPDGREITLWFDGSGKVTRDNGTFDEPVANAFSLVQVVDCPFATPTCRSICYVHILEANEREVHDKYILNSRTIRVILSNSLYIMATANAFAKYVNENCRGGFRWHVSGDIFSWIYACFIRLICLETPNVRHWIYTRSYDYVAPLVGLPNLVVNLSADKDNLSRAIVTAYRFGLRICYLTVDGLVPDDLPAGSVIFPNHSLRGRELPRPTDAPWWQSITPEQRRMVCPADFFGQSPNIRCGPCRKCLK
ncbi:MAG: hypothetical protein HZA94_01445 [Candidatus Vogelbacteria bacterium]|nr:hypothetical protein [Candidatus Vogelbacteria bacterium]